MATSIMFMQIYLDINHYGGFSATITNQQVLTVCYKQVMCQWAWHIVQTVLVLESSLTVHVKMCSQQIPVSIGT